MQPYLIDTLLLDNNRRASFCPGRNINDTQPPVRVLSLMSRFPLLAGALILAAGCSSPKSAWYKGAHKAEASRDFAAMAHCTKLPAVKTGEIRLTEEVVPIKFPGSFRDPSGVQVHGYMQRLGNGRYFAKSIDDARVRHHERGHVHMFEAGVNGGHPRQYQRCFFLWRLSTWGPQPEPVPIVDTVYDAAGNRIEIHE